MYTYQKLNEDLSYLAYCGVDVGSIGTSAAGNAIPYAHVGEYHGAQVIITGGIHARENVTSLLVMRQAFRTAFGRDSFSGGIYFLPMLNPDGALLIEKGAFFTSKPCANATSTTSSDINNSAKSSSGFSCNSSHKSSCCEGLNSCDISREYLSDKTGGRFDSTGDNDICRRACFGNIGDGDCTCSGCNVASGGSETDRNGGLSRAEFLLQTNGSDDFSLWKANANGVDLNNNFDAKFGEGLGQKDSPAPQGYHGSFPFSEPESSALKNFTLSIKPALTLSYHALGREIYWSFFQDGLQKERDFALAKRLEDALNYTWVDGADDTDNFKLMGSDSSAKCYKQANTADCYKRVDEDGGSTGGYKDWCIQTLKIPAFTVEIISPTHAHPLTDSDLDDDWEANKNIPYLLAEMANNLL